MDDLETALAAQTERVEEAVASGSRDAITALDASSSVRCDYTMLLAGTGSGGPQVTARAYLDAGGDLFDAQLVARDGDRSASVDLVPGTSVWHAIQTCFLEAWDRREREDIDADPDVGEHSNVRVLDLQPGDEIVRLGMTVTGYENAGYDTRGELLLAVRFKGSVGAEVWPADRLLLVARSA